MTVNNKLKHVNWVYVAVTLIAVALAVTKYGLSSVWQTIITFFCIVQLVFNLVSIYNILKRRWEGHKLAFNSKQATTIILSFLAIGLFFTHVLTDYSRIFILTYSGMILTMLLIFDLGKMIFKKFG